MDNSLEDFRRDLTAYAVSLSSDHSRAEDLVQDTFLKVLEGAPVPHERPKAKRYVFRMLRNLYIDRIRKAKVRSEYSAAQKRLYSEYTGSEFDAADSLIVREAFSQLSDDHREIIHLVDVQGLKYDEVADRLNIARGTVMSRLSRARAEMIKVLGSSEVIPMKKQEGE